MIIETRNFFDKKGRKRIECLRKCSNCSSEEWVNDYYTLKEKKRHYCKNCSNKQSGKKKRGKTSPLKGKRRKNESEYKLGSTYINNNGYVEEYVGDLNNSRKGKYYLQHRKIMEEMIGRKLERYEIVHHIDGNKQNNSKNNLILCSTNREHTIIHDELEKVSYELFKKGIIKFDRKQKIYKININENN